MIFLVLLLSDFMKPGPYLVGCIVPLGAQYLFNVTITLFLLIVFAESECKFFKTDTPLNFFKGHPSQSSPTPTSKVLQCWTSNRFLVIDG